MTPEHWEDILRTHYQYVKKGLLRWPDCQDRLKAQAVLYDGLQSWDIQARPEQHPPEGVWNIWLILGGRGAGKTRTGAEWVSMQVRAGARRIALVGPSYNEVREVMIEGESGLLNLWPPSHRPVYLSSRRRLQWPCGAVGQVFSAEAPDGLRGGQFEFAWADEFCAWAYPEDTLSNLQFCLRLGQNPKLVMTTTPKPMQILRDLIKRPGVVLTHTTTFDNKANLSAGFLENINATYGDTRLGRQEIEGQILTDFEGALWTHDFLERARISNAPKLDKIVIGLDPPTTSTKASDACGLVAVGCTGQGLDRRAYVLEDASISGLRPDQWVKRAAALYEKWQARYILAEVNQGGEMVQTMFDTLARPVAVRTVFASKRKSVRAEPVALLYERGRVKHVGTFRNLEDELLQFGSKDARNHSPDRLDALVWAITDLMLAPNGAPRIRQL